MIPSEVKAAIFHALNFKLEFEQRQLNSGQIGSNQYKPFLYQTQTALEWLEQQEVEPCQTQPE